MIRSLARCGAVVVFFFAVALGSPARAQCLDPLGDLDGSQQITVVDVQCGLLTLLWNLASLGTDPPPCLAGGPETLDISCNGAGDLADVQLLITLALHIPLSPLVDADANGCPDSCEDTGEDVAVEFFGDIQFWSGPLSVVSGDTIWASQGLRVQIQSWPAHEAHTATLFWRKAGSDDPFQPELAALLATDAGEFGTNALWEVQLDTAALDAVGEGAALEVYLQIEDTLGNTLYASNSGANYHFPINGSATGDDLQFTGGSTYRVGTLARSHGDDIYAGLDLNVTVQTWPPSFDHVVTLYYTTDGQQNIHSVPMEFSAAGAGPFGANFEWKAAVAGSELASDATLELWISATNGATTLYDSNGGANYQFPVIDPAQSFAPTFAAPGKFTFSKCHWDGSSCEAGWKYSSGIANPLVASYSQYQVYGAWTHPAAELYIPGVTDAPPDDPEAKFALESLLRFRVASPLFHEDPAAEYGYRELGVSGKTGNNFILQWMFFQTGCTCPIGFDWPVLGMYPYRYEWSADAGASWSELELDDGQGGTAALTIDWLLAPL